MQVLYLQRKPNGKLNLLVDLGKFNTLIVLYSTNSSHPVSTLSDAGQHLAGKTLFCKLDCSLAYHCLQMADQQFVGMLTLVLLAELLPTKDLNKVSGDLYLPFPASCVSSWNQ